MFIVTVTVHVKPDHIPAFISATLENARQTRQEPNNLRFDVLQSTDTPTHFTLYEAYATQDAFQSHQSTLHYLAWKSAVADLMAQPRTSVKSHALFFDNAPL